MALMLSLLPKYFLNYPHIKASDEDEDEDNIRNENGNFGCVLIHCGNE